MAIGKAGPNAESIESDVWAGCRSVHRHPTSNFAILSSRESSAVEDIRTFCEGHKGFLVYTLSEPGSDSPEALLRKHGFGPLMSLEVFVGRSLGDAALVRWEEAHLKASRLETSHFMVEQFFFAQSQAVRDMLAMATAASGLTIQKAFVEEREVGAALCPRTTGMLGLYNLCVPRSLRRKGYGALMVRSLLSIAGEENRDLVLQCDRRLVPWYEGLGLKWAGTVDVYCLESC